MFVGFGYLMTFLRRYGLGAVGFTMFITCLGVEFAMIVESYMATGKFAINFKTLLNGNFAVAALLISFGGMIGKVSPLQITVFTLIELVCYCANKVVFLTQYADTPYIADCGGTIIIHVFGAYFGLCACRTLKKTGNVNEDRNSYNESNYTSDIFSLIGTVFLWLFWPSFVAGYLDSGEGQTKALINTVLALLSSAVVTFGLTPILKGHVDKEKAGLLDTVAIQNATLAGGVSIGATANAVGPFGAVVIGAIAGALSTYGFVKGTTEADIDTCGINNLHGMPGLLGGLVSVAVPFMYPENAKGLNMVASNQFVGLLITLGFACVGGCATGIIMHEVAPPPHVHPYEDSAFWDIEPEQLQ